MFFLNTGTPEYLSAYSKGSAMGCHSIGHDLSAYLDGQLRPAAARQMEDHLQRCERCRAELADLRAVKALLVGAPRPQAPPGFWDAVHAGLRTRASQHATGGYPRQRVRRQLAAGCRGTRCWGYPPVACRLWSRAPVMAAGLAALLLAAILPIQYLQPEPARNGVTVDDLIVQHAGYCAREPLLEHGRLHYLIAEADVDERE
jgi:anti-sigma factor RsiW